MTRKARLSTLSALLLPILFFGVQPEASSASYPGWSYWRPDLTATYVEVVRHPGSPETIRASVRVMNRGNASSGYFLVRFVIGGYVIHKSVSSLPPGGYTMVWVEIPTPPGIPSGYSAVEDWVPLFCHIDNFNWIRESNELNNAFVYGG